MRRFRKERVASAVHEIVSDALSHRLNDPRVEPMTTITRVEVTGDLLIARILVTIPGGATAESRTMAALQHARGYVQGIVARELNLRQCPQLRFEVDTAWKEARRTMELLDEIRKTQPHSIPPDGEGEELVPLPPDDQEIVDELESEAQDGGRP